MLTRLGKWAASMKDACWPFIDALSGADDPQGEYLHELERRVRRLEAEIGSLRSHSIQPSDARH